MISRRTARVIGTLLALALLVGVGYALRWRKHPSPCPYSQRVWVDLPRPVLTRSSLHDLLEPEPDERILEIGPGTGYYTGSVARALEPNGTLHAVDVQPEMVDHLRERVRAREQPVEPVVGDARSLPYRENRFDAAYLVLVLGEVPDREQALGELARVLKPGGRLVVGESLPDPHFVTLGTLERRAERRGLEFEERVGSRGSYFARFSAPGSSDRD